MNRLLLSTVLGLLAGCAAPSATRDAEPAPTAVAERPEAAPTSAPSAPARSAAPSGSALAAAPAEPPAAPSGGAPAVGAVDAGPADAAAPAAQAFAPDNKVKPPLESDDLTERARGLLQAIAQDDPALADPLWFPREPFIPLKDIKDPGKYWDQLHKTYANDVRALHRKRKSWEGARFIGFQVGSTPKWVPPGDEANKIGYYRSFHGTLKYEVGGEAATLDVHTIISWQGRWYITHLSRFKKKK